VDVTVNGERHALDSGSTISAVVALLRGDDEGRGVAVALNGEVISRSRWRDTEVRDGSVIEVLGAIGGG
jgi:sulfur carrier protein